MQARHILVGTLLVGVVVGFAVGSASPSLFGFSAKAGGPTTGIPSESLVIATGTGCVDQTESQNWVGQQPIHDVMSVSLNYTVTHEASIADVNATLEPTANGDYFLRIETGSDRAASAKKGTPPADCQPGTHIDAAVTVPRDYNSITVVVDRQTVTTIEGYDSSFARYRTIHTTR